MHISLSLYMYIYIFIISYICTYFAPSGCTITAHRHGYDAMARRLASHALPLPSSRGRGAAAAARGDRADRAALEDPLLVAKSLQVGNPMAVLRF